MLESDIVIRGAREHNLQNVSLRLPRNKLIVMTGVSGSGKSSLAFDTLYAEGQRRYVESLSSYARQFLGQMPKPEVDAVSGLAPSISIQQKTSGRNPRSTVGTITEIYDYLRVLYARVGQGRCPKCRKPITAQTVDQILEVLWRMPEGTRFLVLAPVIQRQKGEYRDLFEDLLKRGYLRARVDGKVVALSDDLRLDRHMRHTIEVVVDRLKAGQAGRSRLAEAIESAVRLSQGSVLIVTEGGPEGDDAEAEAPAPELDETDDGDDAVRQLRPTERLFSTHYACADCGISYEPPSPQLFSFNSPQGMCPACQGLGRRHDFDRALLIPDPSLSLWTGAIELIGPIKSIGKWRKHLYEGVAAAIEKDHDLPAGKLLKTPWEKLVPEIQEKWLHGTGDRHITFAWRHSGGVWKHGGTFEGFIPELLDSYRKSNNAMRRRQLEKYMQFVDCHTCRGSRLNPQASAVTLTTAREDWRGARSLGLPDVCKLSLADAATYFEQLELDATGQLIAAEVLKEIRGRIGFLLRCGLDYLTLDRTAPTLSGGESQRIRLASQIGCGLVGVVYILDEPSIGLHPRDNARLLDSLLDLRDQGNTVIVVEHDEETIRAADHVVDFGPGPGVRGGEVVAEGTVHDVMKSAKSVTGKFLSGREQIAIPKDRRPRGDRSLSLRGVTHHNLRDFDIEIPLGQFVCVTGASGSGKSSLVNDVLWKALNRDLNRGEGEPGKFAQLLGLEHLDKAIDIDQSPIGRTPRSNPATYVKLFDLIRDLYTQLPESKLRGYEPGRFSFNVAGGRCEACEGHGSTKLDMDFLADVWVTCPVCGGHRFMHEILEVRYKGKNIADVLEMDVQQALEHFENIPKIKHLLQTLHDVGLDYLKLGQPSPTLSGGEAQRIKLARELGKRSTGGTLYLLDEPTTGLHFADVRKLLEVLHGFVDQGNTVLVVEHNLDVLKTADWLIDLGPGGGEHGGKLVIAGTPEEVADCAESYTGQALAPVLGRAPAPVHARPLPTKPPESRESILIRGAAQHNLQRVDVDIPREQMSVFCGPSGSGKSSLAMETLYAEGQRRYVESLSAYARQFLGQMPKPRLEQISGLSPAIAIEQKNTGHTPRSTVGTVTEIYDYLRILFARLGQPHCPDCRIPVSPQTSDEVIDRLQALPEGTKLLLLAPQAIEVGESYDKLWETLKTGGYQRVRIDGATHRLDDVPTMDRRRKHEVDVVVDRVTIARGGRSRLADSVLQALQLGRGVMRAAHVDEAIAEKKWRVDRFSLHFACEQCGRSFEELTPHQFSFNSPLGWCPSCSGLGVQTGTNLSNVIRDPKLTLREGALGVWPRPGTSARFDGMLAAVAAEIGCSLDVPFNKLTDLQQRGMMFGTGDAWLTAPGQPPFQFKYKGIYPAIESATSMSFVYRARLTEFTGEVACEVCRGSRLRDDASAVRFQERTIQQLCDLPLSESLEFFKKLKLPTSEKRIAGDLLHEVRSRLSFLVDVGLDYLTLGRPLPTLSGGEMQRIRLAGQIGRSLTGVLYVLDEPTVGLHPRDNARLLQALKALRDLGNTLVLVEHDREVIAAADRLYDFGPGAGRFGGNITAHGTPADVTKNADSLTGRYLGDRESIPAPTTRRVPPQAERSAEFVPPGGGWLTLSGARMHNLRDVTLRLPLGTLTCITGVSGSGKSTLVEDTLAKALARKLHRAQVQPGPHDSLLGAERIDKIIQVDQQPLGATPASNPATYTGVFDEIRELYARLPDARLRGYRSARFSFNRPGGRCEACEGNGQKCIEMHFLPDVWVECDACKGERYNQETLAIKFRGKSISDVLKMSIGEARELFDNVPKIRSVLATLCAIGLDYLTLGQSAPTLSGGEAQRVKLAAELARPQTGKTLYILDEPTTGLHFDDIRKLLKVLDSLVAQGNTVVVIEHNLDVIKTADWLIDLGPEAGAGGGRIVAEGTPEDVVALAAPLATNGAKPNGKKTPSKKKATSKGAAAQSTAPLATRSYTAEMLAPVLANARRADREIFDAKAAGKQKKGDLSYKDLERESKMPWEIDGPRWHLFDRVSHQGKKVRWQGEALQLVTDWLAEQPELAPLNWGSRSVVEATAAGQSEQWFLHALTGDEWLLTLNFRVPHGTVKANRLAEELNLQDIDDLDELPVYGRAPRVRVRGSRGTGWQEVTITVHWHREIDTPAFREFLELAWLSYLEQVRPEAAPPKPKKRGAAPRSVERQRPLIDESNAGNLSLVKRLTTLLLQAGPNSTTKVTSQAIRLQLDGGRLPWSTLDLKQLDAIKLVLTVPPGHVAFARIATLGLDPVIDRMHDVERVQLQFNSLDQLDSPDLPALLADCARWSQGE